MTEKNIENNNAPDQENEREYANAILNLEHRCKIAGIKVEREKAWPDESFTPIVCMP